VTGLLVGRHASGFVQTPLRLLTGSLLRC